MKGVLKSGGVNEVYQKIRDNGPIIDSLINRNPMSPGHYPAWIESIEASSVRRKPNSGPVISILMPIYKPNHQYLSEAIDSILAQNYQSWELCIHDDGSDEADLSVQLAAWQKLDVRIKFATGETNLGISDATNRAARLASGTYFTLMDQDDRIATDALSHIAEAISENPKAKLLYSDEDKLSATGERETPYFKPDFNYQLLLSQNYICHLVTFERTIFEQVGGFRAGLDGAQDHDLILRIIERLTSEQINHIPAILYHWRMHARSTATDVSAKPKALDAGKRAVRDHLNRKKIQATVEVTGIRYRVKYETPGDAKVTIIIPTRNGAVILSRCIESILKLTDYRNYSILVVDNGSDDFATLQYLKSLSAQGIEVMVANQPFNFAALNNLAVNQSDADFVCLLNDDTEVISVGWLREMVSHASQTNVGAVGAKLLYPDDTIQHAGVILGVGGVAGHGHKHFGRNEDGYFSRLQVSQNLSAVTAACLLTKRSIWHEVGGMEERLAVAFNDIDFCIKLTSAGYSIVWTPWAELYHHESISRGYESTPEKQARFRQETEFMVDRWGPILAKDPHYNQHLTLKNESFMLRQPAEY